MSNPTGTAHDGGTRQDGVPTEITTLVLSSAERLPSLLERDLLEAGFACEVERAENTARLLSRLQRGEVDLLVIPLPLDPSIDPVILDQLAVSYPELSVVFHWLDAPASTGATIEPFETTVRAALSSRAAGTWNREEQRALLSQVIRQQQVHLRLSKQSPKEFHDALEQITEELAQLLGVERVSVWEFTPSGLAMECLDLYEASEELHSTAPPLTSFPRYLASLRASLTVAAHDARQDPRTNEFLEEYLVPRGITALLDAPIRREGRVVGVICHEHVGESTRKWTVLDRCAAAAAASLVGRVLESRDRRAVEERLNQLERLRAVGDLAGGIAHDLNNMLGILVGNLELARTAIGDTSVAATEALERATRAGLDMQQLADDLLEIGREGAIRTESLDLCAFIERHEPLARSAAGSHAALSIETLCQRTMVRADPSACTRILINLVKNAGEAIDTAGSIRIGLETREVVGAGKGEITNAVGIPAGAYAVVSIEDNGPGMEASVRDRVFEPMFSRRKKGRGTGLGLATSFGLARQLGGTIVVESEPGEGSAFRWWIPLID